MKMAKSLALLHVASVTAAQSCCTLLCICMCSTLRVTFTCNAVQSGKIYSQGSGTQPLADTLISEKRQKKH